MVEKREDEMHAVAICHKRSLVGLSFVVFYKNFYSTRS
jgi:hypothetical protein